MIKTIPLNRLVASPRNVRRSSDPKADLELKADIEVRDLLQNLVDTSAARPSTAATKPELVQVCERIRAGDFIAEAEVKEAAFAWAPEAMRFGASNAPVAPEGDAGQLETSPAAGCNAEADQPAAEIEGAA